MKKAATSRLFLVCEILNELFKRVDLAAVFLSKNVLAMEVQVLLLILIELTTVSAVPQIEADLCSYVLRQINRYA